MSPTKIRHFTSYLKSPYFFSQGFRKRSTKRSTVFENRKKHTSPKTKRITIFENQKNHVLPKTKRNTIFENRKNHELPKTERHTPYRKPLKTRTAGPHNHIFSNPSSPFDSKRTSKSPPFAVIAILRAPGSGFSI